jgi:hypothetical protein
MFKWNQDLRSVKIAQRHGMRTAKASVKPDVRGFTHRPLNTITSFLNENPGTRKRRRRKPSNL